MRSLTAWTEARSQSRLDRSSLRGKGLKLIGTALYGAVRRVVWDPGANYSRGPDSVLLLLGFDKPFGSILAAKLLGTGVVILVLRENTKHRINLV